MENKAALIVVDTIQTFANRDLGQLYVPWGEKVAERISDIIPYMRDYFGATIINVFESHPEWHISFASSYENKNPDDNQKNTITLEEISTWTDTTHSLSRKAKFKVDQLRNYLAGLITQADRLWPDHAMAGSQGAHLMPPLTLDMFHEHIVKWDEVDTHPYGWFGGTKLDSTLKANNIHRNFIVGIAAEFCVKETALESLTHWYETYVITDAVAALDPTRVDEVFSELELRGVKLITTTQLENALSWIN